MSIDVRCRPIDDWHGAHTHPRRSAPYGVRWERSLTELRRELKQLQARDVTIGIDVMPSQIRVDGWPKGGAAVPAPVVLTFVSQHGPLRYQCDRWDDWRDNLRAITLVLQRQRLVNEAGVGQADQVYRGFGALPPGDPIALSSTSSMSVEEAARFICEHSGQDWSHELADDPSFALVLFKDAVKLHHPDAGGDAAVFRRLTVAREVLERWAA